MRWNNSSRVIAAPGFIEPGLPPDAIRAPDGPLWIREIKHDGYRLLLVRKCDGKVRIYTRRAVDWTKRFPRIVEAAMKLRAASLGRCLWDEWHRRFRQAAQQGE
jgi:ATP-dependent DNA ligase